MSVRRILRVVSDALFPPQCVGCDAPGTSVCRACAPRFAPRTIQPHPRIYALYPYSDPAIQKALWRMKYHQSRHARILFARILAVHISRIPAFSATPPTTPIRLVATPSSRLQQAHDTRDHIARICAALSRAHSGRYAYNTPSLARTRAVVPQTTTQSRTERLYNMDHALSLAHTEATPPAADSPICVLDDITTTGATLTEALRAFHEAGYTHAYGCAIAYQPAPQQQK